MTCRTALKRAAVVAGTAAAAFVIGALPSYAAGEFGSVPGGYVDQDATIGSRALPYGYLQYQDGRCVGNGVLVDCNAPYSIKFVAQQIAPGEYVFTAPGRNGGQLCLAGRRRVVQPCDNRDDQRWLAVKLDGDPGQPPWGLKAVGVQGPHECLVSDGNYVGTGYAVGSGSQRTCPNEWE